MEATATALAWSGWRTAGEIADAHDMTTEDVRLLLLRMYVRRRVDRRPVKRDRAGLLKGGSALWQWRLS